MTHIRAIVASDERAVIEQELQQIRHRSLMAARRGDYHKLAQLTLKVIRLSDRLSERIFNPHDIQTANCPVFFQKS